MPEEDVRCQLLVFTYVHIHVHAHQHTYKKYVCNLTVFINIGTAVPTLKIWKLTRREEARLPPFSQLTSEQRSLRLSGPLCYCILRGKEGKRLVLSTAGLSTAPS